MAVYHEAPSQYTTAQIQERAKDMRVMLKDSSLFQAKHFIRSFVEWVTVKLPQVEIDYTLPLKNDKGEPRLSEVLLLSPNDTPPAWAISLWSTRRGRKEGISAPQARSCPVPCCGQARPWMAQRRHEGARPHSSG